MMLVRQALYGERNKGHALLACTPGSEAVADAIRAYTDRASDRPPQLDLPSYVTGLRVESHYVVMRTARDPVATRPGMVLTHAVFVSADVASALGDVGALLATLPAVPARDADLSPVSVAGTPPPPAPPNGTVELLLAAFLSETRPVAWIGEEGFEEAVRVVWGVLAPGERASFTFGFAFGPKGAPGLPGSFPVLVRTPRALRARWTGHVVVDPAAPQSTCPVPSPAVAALLDKPGGEAVRLLRDAAEIDALSLGDYRTLEIAAPLFHRFESDTATSTDLRTLAHALGRLVPDPERAPGLKRRLLSALSDATREGSDVLGLRNLNLAPYPDTQSFWARAADGWAGAATAGDPERASADADVISQAAVAGDASWATAVLDAASRAARLAPQFAWSWWAADATLVPILLDRLPKGTRVESLLADAAPYPPPVASAVRDAARTRRLFLLHAHVLPALLDPSDAFAEQLDVDPGVSRPDALRRLAEGTGAAATVLAAVRAHPAPAPLVDLAAEAATSTPATMGGLDATDPAWRAVWAQSVRSGGDVWSGVTEPDSARDGVLDALLDDARDRDLNALVEAVSHTARADLGEYPRRAELWGHLSGDARARFLAATAEGWTRRAEAGMPDWRIEPDLASVTLDPARNPDLFDPNRPGVVPLAAEAFARSGTLGENAFVLWIRSLAQGPRLTKSDALVLGSLIHKRGWRRAASAAFSVAESSRIDFRPAVSQFADLLGLADRIFARIMSGTSNPTLEEWWPLLDQLARELLPTSDALEPFWERAGGAVSDLKSSGSGGDRASHAVALIRKGGSVTATSFVSGLRGLYALNTRLDMVESVGRDLGILRRAH